MSEELFPEHRAIESRIPGAVTDWHSQHGDRTLVIGGRHLTAVARMLREEMGYNFLVDITCVDYHKRRPRFEIVYHLMNMNEKKRLRLKIQSDEDHPDIPSLTPLWRTADWLEREVWDLFGVKFTGHPNLKRIMLYEEFKGHPLRKDYPKTKRQPLIGPKT